MKQRKNDYWQKRTLHWQRRKRLLWEWKPQTSELQVSSKGLELNKLTVDNSKPVQKRDIHWKIVTSKGKYAETVVSKVTLTKYAGHPSRVN